MKTLKVPIYHTFTNWLMIVIIGSLLCPHIGQLLTGTGAVNGSRNSMEDALEISLLCMAASAICSLPALVIMFVTHLVLNRKGISKKQHMLIQNGVHIGVSLLTFAVFWGLAKRDADFVVILFLSYVPAGLFVWNICYLFQKEKISHVVKGTDLLDEF